MYIASLGNRLGIPLESNGGMRPGWEGWQYIYIATSKVSGSYKNATCTSLIDALECR